MLTDFNKVYAVRKTEWFDWYWNKASEIEKKLYDLISDYSEEYFADFRFEPNTIVDDYVRIETTDEDGGDWESTSLDAPDILEYFGDIVLHSFQYKVEPLDEYVLGQVNSKDLVVTVIPEMVNEYDGKPHILHELIHIYESALDVLPKFYHDILLICLYNNLRNKISDIDDRMLRHTHIYYGNEITMNGGEHDILFLLKSFDLDLKCGYKIGTVCGYDRDQY